MFRNRQSSQKPPDELFERFRQSFPSVRGVSSAGEDDGKNTLALSDNIDNLLNNEPRFGNHEDMDPTPKAPTEAFRFTPSLLDPSSSAFAAFANQPPGLFTPTPGGANGHFGINASSSFLSSSGGLETPNIGISIDTPLSMSGVATMPVPSMPALPQTIQPQDYHNYQPYGQHQFLNPSNYDHRGPSGPGSPMDMSGGEMTQEPTSMERAVNVGSDAPALPLDGKFGSDPQLRFSVVLHAPTAMIKHPDEVPVTYLNKGQAYAISIVDTNPPPPTTFPVRYRTFVRISFHDETQRNRPAQCWQLWKEGRGTNEAHQRGGKLQAVEYVEVQPNADEEKRRKAKVEIESASFDGFSVSWSPTPNEASETSVSVRFNFLSTDFSHSKGVKGIPVRLCAKTEVVPGGSPPGSPPQASELCYCKVKLFRDHGAERKLANDVLHVKKTIEKLKQQQSQVDGASMKGFGKKPKKEAEPTKPGKVIKHKRTWSMSSAGSAAGSRNPEDDTEIKLRSMQDMFSSTRTVSVLYLHGDEADDPDVYPVSLPNSPPDPDDVWAHRRSSVASHSTAASSFISPSPSSASLSSLARGGDYSSPEKDWEQRTFHALSRAPNDVPVKVKASSNDAGMLPGWIEAIGIESSYQPPPEPAKAVMSVYILPVVPNHPTTNSYYRAVYLLERSAHCLTLRIAEKCGINPTTILRTIHVDSRGIQVLIDDDFVMQMKEAQDMRVQAAEISEGSPFPSPPRDWPGNEMQTDGMDRKERGWELRLIF